MRLGMHLLSKASNQIFGNESAERTLMVDVLRRMGITDVKLVTDGDSQLKAAQYLHDQGFNVLVRFYKEPVNTEAVPDDQLRLFAPYVYAVEGYINEPEIEWGRPPSADVIDSLARAWIRFADACGRCGVTPVTPAIQGDRVLSWFRPMCERVIALVRKDTFDHAFIGCHPRPANNLPGTPPPGFVARSYEDFAAVCRDLRIEPRLLATEWGYEPGDAANQTLPRIDLQRHADYNVRLAQMEHPDLVACYYWTWLHDWFDSGWWRGSIESSLPVVKAFIDMPHELDVPEPEFPDWPEAGVEARIREWCWNHAYPGPIPYNPDAAFQKLGVAFAPVTHEMHEGGWAAQGFADGVWYCKEGDWAHMRFLPWTQ